MNGAKRIISMSNYPIRINSMEQHVKTGKGVEMRVFTVLFLTFIIFISGASNLFAQSKTLNDLRKSGGRRPLFLDEDLPINRSSNKQFPTIKNTPSRLNSISVIDNVIATKADDSERKVSFTYDSNGNMTSRLYEGGDNDPIRYTYTYNANGNIISKLEEHRDGAQWINYRRSTYSYDANDNNTSTLLENWDGDNSQWVNFYLLTYTYDANDDMSLALTESWDGAQWVKQYQSTYTYDLSGNMISELFGWWENGTWDTSHRYTYTYDSYGNIISEFWESVSIWSNEWENSRRYTYTYDSYGTNRISELFEQWIIHSTGGAEWETQSRTTYTYDVNGNMLSMLEEDWRDTGWENEWRLTYTYNLNGDMTGLSEIWNGSQWAEGDGQFSFTDSFGREFGFYATEIKVYYKTITGIEESKVNITDYSLAQNYPNPFNPSTTISYTLPQNGVVQLKVYDMLGKEVAVLVNKNQIRGSYKIKFDASSLPSGIYFYTLKSGSFSETKKLILLR